MKIAGKAVTRTDTAYIVGCLFRALELHAYALACTDMPDVA